MKGLVIALSILMLAGWVNVASATQAAKVNLCHQTSSEQHPWEAIQVDMSAWQTHVDQHGDFLYAGPVKDNGKPTKDGNQWCADNVPQPEEPEEPTEPEEPEQPPEGRPDPDKPAGNPTIFVGVSPEGEVHS